MYISIRLKSRLQSWGDDSKSKTFGVCRNTMILPSISGVRGVIATCLGARHGTQEYAEFTESVRYDTAVSSNIPQTMVDYQSVGGGFDDGDEFQKNMILVKADGTKPVGYGNAKITNREYLVNADFVVILEVLDEYAQKLIKALKDPEWVPSLGRACCIPSTRLFLSEANTFEEALEGAKRALNSDNVYTYSTIYRGERQVSTAFDLPINGRKYRNTSRVLYSNY